MALAWRITVERMRPQKGLCRARKHIRRWTRRANCDALETSCRRLVGAAPEMQLPFFSLLVTRLSSGVATPACVQNRRAGWPPTLRLAHYVFPQMATIAERRCTAACSLEGAWRGTLARRGMDVCPQSARPGSPGDAASGYGMGTGKQQAAPDARSHADRLARAARCTGTRCDGTLALLGGALTSRTAKRRVRNNLGHLAQAPVVKPAVHRRLIHALQAQTPAADDGPASPWPDAHARWSTVGSSRMVGV